MNTMNPMTQATEETKKMNPETVRPESMPQHPAPWNSMRPATQRAFGLVMTASALMPVAIQLSEGWGLPIASYLGLSAAVQHLYKTQLADEHAATPAASKADSCANEQNATRRQRIFLAIHALGCAGMIAALWFSGRLAHGF